MPVIEENIALEKLHAVIDLVNENGIRISYSKFLLNTISSAVKDLSGIDARGCECLIAEGYEPSRIIIGNFKRIKAQLDGDSLSAQYWIKINEEQLRVSPNEKAIIAIKEIKKI